MAECTLCWTSHDDDRPCPTVAPETSHAFSAKYDGRCFICRDQISIGQVVCFREDRVVHRQCRNTYAQPDAPEWTI